jgi:hypothetical protein
MLEQVDWDLPGMENIGEDMTRWLVRLIREGELINSIHCLGWGFWPTKNGGYLDERTLRVLADFIEIQNKPFWDEYDKWCEEHPPEQEGDELCLDELGFTATPTSITGTSASSSVNPE